MKRISLTTLSIILIFVVFCDSAFARPSKTNTPTPAKRFDILTGCWFITNAEPAIAFLNDTFACFNDTKKKPTGDMGRLDVDNPNSSSLSIELRKRKKKADKIGIALGIKRKGDFTVKDSATNKQVVIDAIGASGKLSLKFPGGQNFNFFLGTIKANGGKLTFRADRVPSNFDPGTSMTFKVRKQGGLVRCGKAAKFTIDVINRGPQVLAAEDDIIVGMHFKGVDSFEITKVKRANTCKQVESAPTASLCILDYLGPPEKKTFATIVGKTKVGETTGDEVELELSIVDADSNLPILNDPSRDIIFKVKKGSKKCGAKSCPTLPAACPTSIIDEDGFTRAISKVIDTGNVSTLRTITCVYEGELGGVFRINFIRKGSNDKFSTIGCGVKKGPTSWGSKTHKAQVEVISRIPESKRRCLGIGLAKGFESLAEKCS